MIKHLSRPYPGMQFVREQSAGAPWAQRMGEADCRLLFASPTVVRQSPGTKPAALQRSRFLPPPPQITWSITVTSLNTRIQRRVNKERL